MNDFLLGCHLSCSRGLEALAQDMTYVGGNVAQCFLRNPRGGSAKTIVRKDADAYLAIARERGFGPLLVHAPYTLNACSDKPETRRFAHDVFADDLARMEEFVPGNLYNFHPGSHVGQGVDEGVRLIVEQLDAILSPSLTTTVLLETMAGKGSEVGGRFEELRRIRDAVKCPERLGVCLDTCHVHDAGYDVVNRLDDVLEEFDRVVGLAHLRAVHLNDSKNPLASRKDRHECIGKGFLGLPAIARIVNHPQLRALPFYLETPYDALDGWKGEIALLRGERV